MSINFFNKIMMKIYLYPILNMNKMKMIKYQCLLFIKNEYELNLVKNRYKKYLKKKIKLFLFKQLDVLESTFQQHRYPSIDIIDDLVEQLNLPTQKITVI